MYLETKVRNNINDKNYKTILKNYKFTDFDAKQLYSIQNLVDKHEKVLLDGFYEFIFEFDYAKSFLHNQEILKRHEEGIKSWYKNLFCGKYDESYFYKLNIISEIHVRIGLPAHYVNAAFSYIRGFLKDIIVQEKKCEVISSLDKIIDINLDILTISYREEEQTKLIDEVIFLKSVVEKKGIYPHVQAIYNSKTLKKEKYECLMRLETADKSKISVYPYLELSKKLKLYDRMTKVMISKSFEMFESLDIELSLNLSYEDISNDEFRHFLYKKIKKHKYPKNIIFEILETDFIEDFSIVEDFIKTIRTFGCKIAIDDFGSGFSSMENILKLNPDYIKIDGSLIKDIHTSNNSKTIVKNIVNMAKELDAKTVAEYVHNEEVFNIVKDLNVDYLQGFYLSEPSEKI